MPKKPTPEMQTAFVEFVAEIDTLLAELQELLRSSRAYRHVSVAYDDKTLDEIEGFYLDVLSRKEKVDVKQQRLDQMYVAYIGEAEIHHLGGRWVLGDDDFTFGEPSVASEGMIIFSPMYRINLQKKDRKRFLKEMIDYCVNKDQFEKGIFEGLE